MFYVSRNQSPLIKFRTKPAPFRKLAFQLELESRRTDQVMISNAKAKHEKRVENYSGRVANAQILKVSTRLFRNIFLVNLSVTQR